MHTSTPALPVADHAPAPATRSTPMSVALAPSAPLGLTQVAFVGEVVLLVRLIGWGGRRRAAIR